MYEITITPTVCGEPFKEKWESLEGGACPFCGDIDTIYYRPEDLSVHHGPVIVCLRCVKAYQVIDVSCMTEHILKLKQAVGNGH